MNFRPEQTFTNLPMIMIDEPGDSGVTILGAPVAGGIVGEGTGEQIIGEGASEPMKGE